MSIANQEEYAFVQSLHSSAIWLGYNDIDHEGTFVWSDGSPDTFQKWYRGEPNNAGGGEDCAYTRGGKSSSTWNDLGCVETQRKPFVCET